MEEALKIIFAPDPLLPWYSVALALIMAFLLGMVVAFVYQKTHQGLSYSRSFVHALVLSSIVASTLLLAVGNNLARGVAILGAMALIRFRSTMKDPKDMVFIFASLALGIACGVRAFAVAVAGAIVFSFSAWLLRYTLFGARVHHDGIVRMVIPADREIEQKVREILVQHCTRWIAVTLRDVAQGKAIEHSYFVTLAEKSSVDILTSSLASIPGVSGVAFFAQEASTEV